MNPVGNPNSAPLIVTALLGDADFAWADALRRDNYPVDRNQVPAHLTLFHQLPPASEPELAGRLAGYAAAPRPRARITGVIDLGGGTALRVESEELEDIRGDLALALSGLLPAQDRAPWTPHITIQNKVEPREARRLQAALRASLTPRPLVIKGLASWRYLGGPWQPARRYSFRG